MSYNTGNPVGSDDPRDLFDNSKTVDEFANSTSVSVLGRLGNYLLTLFGMNVKFNSDQSERASVFSADQALRAASFSELTSEMDSEFQHRLASIGYEDLGNYQQGINLTTYSQLVRVSGEYFKLSASALLPFTTSGDWAQDKSSFVSVGDNALRGELARENGSSLLGWRIGTADDKLGERLSGLDHGVDYTGATDSNTKILALIAEGELTGKTARLGPGTIEISNVSPTSTTGLRLEGDGMRSTRFKRTGSSNVMTFKGKQYLDLSRFTLDLDKPNSSDNGHGITLIDQPRARVKEVSVVGNRGTGSNIIAYSSDPAVRREGIVFEDLYVEGDIANSTNTNGTLIENGLFCRQSGILAKNIKEFAVEYKNDTRYSLLSDIISYNSNYAIGYGQTTTDGTGVSGCVATGIVALACSTGIVVGKGDLNLFSGAMLNSTGSPGTVKRGVSTATEAEQNMFVGILTAGDMIEPVRFGSSRNYVQIASHDVSTNVVSITSGSEKNVAEIAHPGRRTTILSSILNVSGNPISGATANPVYSHATGEYVGTLSGRWRYRHDVSGASVLSAAKHVVEGKGDVTYNVSTDGTGYAGLQVSTPADSAFVVYRVGSGLGGNWQIGGSGFNFQLSKASVLPSTNGETSLGGPTNKFSEIHALNGTIITSDERAKVDIEAISEAEARVCAKINFRKFRLKDAVERKGESARFHFGVIAQQVKEAFESEGLDAFAYGILCYDEWEASPAVYESIDYGSVYAGSEEGSNEIGELIASDVPAGIDEPGTVWEYTHTKQVLVSEAVEAGSRYGVRYDELYALMLESLQKALL